MVYGNPIGLSYNDISLAFTVMLELMSYMPELLFSSQKKHKNFRHASAERVIIYLPQ